MTLCTCTYVVHNVFHVGDSFPRRRCPTRKHTNRPPASQQRPYDLFPKETCSARYEDTTAIERLRRRGRGDFGVQFSERIGNTLANPYGVDQLVCRYRGRCTC